MTKPRIILFDIETIPNLDLALEVWCQLGLWPGRTMKATITSLLCVGWKELGEKKTHCINLWDTKHKNINDDKELCKKIYDVMSQADAVITHNGKRFDWKYLQTRFIYHELPPLPKIPHVDTCITARQNLLSFNNKLDYLGQYFIKDRKLDNGKWELWVQCHKGVKKAQRLMEKYCKQDVILLEKLFNKLKPFVNNLPNQNTDYQGSHDYVCPNCGSAKVKKSGWAYTKTSKYQRGFCNTCRTYFKFNLKGNKPRTL